MSYANVEIVLGKRLLIDGVTRTITCGTKVDRVIGTVCAADTRNVWLKQLSP